MLLATVDTVVERLSVENVPAPAIIVIGEAVGTHKGFQEQIRQILENRDIEEKQ